MDIMKRKVFLIGLIIALTVIKGYSQIEYFFKLESGFIDYRYNTIRVDSGPNWKGYYLEKRNGIDLNITNGISCNNKFYGGLGIGVLNFEGINGFSVFSDFEYLPLKTRLSPLINLKIGYSHIWNQYKNGTGTILSELGLGLNYRISKNIDIYLKSGFLLTQQSLLIPIRLGFRF